MMDDILFRLDELEKRLAAIELQIKPKPVTTVTKLKIAFRDLWPPHI